VINLPIGLKALVPGYRARWRNRYGCMLSELARWVPRVTFGEDDTGPWLEVRDGPRIHGFTTEPINLEMFGLLRRDMPEALPASHFRLMKDLLTRYVYPHMRPDLKPKGFAVEQMFGFHGQHKDAIADLPDPRVRARLVEAFRPKPDDVILNCGSFIGLGDLKTAPEVAAGRIYSVEANADCFGLLCKNLQTNRANNVTPIHRAMWNELTELQLESDLAQRNTLITEVHKGKWTQSVATVTLDSLVREHDIEKLDFLSLTLNGAEVETLEGGSDTLARLGPRIRLAGWYTREGRKIWQITKDQLEAHDYEVFVGKRGNVMALPRERN